MSDLGIHNPKTVRQVLLEKHPPNIPPVQSAILNGDCNMEPHPVIFDGIDGELIQNTAIKTEGATGPSGLDAMTSGDDSVHLLNHVQLVYVML